MTYIALPDESRTRRLVFYLAMEEYVAAHLDSLLKGRSLKEAFFLWQVEPTVIFGRNQVMEAEVNIEYCKQNGINLFRRKSGGGCVYSDRGNIMLSYITDSTSVGFTFEKFLQRVALTLRHAGLNASTSGRNDVLVDGKKVSGNAFFLLPKSSIVHGTMLFDSDFDALSRAITPSQAKIESKGVDSVRRHVTNLRPYFMAAHTPWQRTLSDIRTFKHFLVKEFCGLSSEYEESEYEEGERIDYIILSNRDIEEIEKIEATYLEPAFLEGRNHRYCAIRNCRIDGIGEFEVKYQMSGDLIEECFVNGDYFSVKEGLEQRLSQALKGCRDNYEEVSGALRDVDLGQYVSGLTSEILTENLYKQNNQ